MITTAPAGAASATHHALRDLGRQRKLGVLRCPHVRHDPAAAPPPRARPPRRRTLSNAPSTEYTNAAFMSRASCTRGGARERPPGSAPARRSAHERAHAHLHAALVANDKERVRLAGGLHTHQRASRSRAWAVRHTHGRRAHLELLHLGADGPRDEGVHTCGGAARSPRFAHGACAQARKQHEAAMRLQQRPPLPHPTPAAGHP